MRRLRPDVVLCLGGFAAFAPSVIAVATGVPVVVTAQNARPSLVNRLIGRFAKASALPFPAAELPRSVLCGNPVRRAVVEAITEVSPGRRALARAGFGVKEDVGDPATLIAVWAGSHGADSINNAAIELVETWRDRGGVFFHHVVGRRNAQLVEAGPVTVNHSVVAYEDNMADLLIAADIAITRGGASTVAELSIAALPAVIVPLPNAPRDHQRANAEELVADGRAVLVADDELTGATLAAAIEPLLAQERRTQMSAQPAAVDHSTAATAVAHLLLLHARNGTGS